MIEKIGEKNINYKKTIIFIFIIAMFLTLISFAVSDVSIKYIEENGVQYIFFKLDHNLANTAYKYFGYGYHVTVYDNDNRKIGYKFLTNAEFKPDMIGGVETVKIPIEELYYKTDVENKYFYRQDCTIWLNGRLGIKVNGVLKFLYDSLEGTPETGLDSLPTGYATFDGQTVPLNKDGKGIRDGIKHEYGVDWSLTTQINLQQHFGIDFRLDPIFKYDGYEVLYKEVSTGKTVSSQKELQNFNEARTITENPETVNGYEYSGYYEIKKVDNRGRLVEPPPKPVTQGDSATVNLSQTASIYTIVFYYNKVDPSTIGKPVTIEIEHRKNTSTGKEIAPSEIIISAERALVNINSKKIDEYMCKELFLKGKETRHFYSTSTSFVVSKEDYSTPIDGKLKIIFVYEEVIPVEIPKCEPTVYGDANTINISMKKKDFENATEIAINNAVFKIDSFKAGKDLNGDIVEGKHEFAYFDLYIDRYSSSYDNRSKEITQSFIVSKDIFNQSTTDTNLYTANIDVTYASFCTCFDGKSDSNGCYGMAIDNGNISVNINLIENKAPVAYFRYYTEKKLEDGSTDSINKAYIGRETIISNKAYDPNGITDISHIKYTLTDSSGKQYYIRLLILQDGSYILATDNVLGDNIDFLGTLENGNIKLKFRTNENWIVSQYVEDLEGLNDIYTTNIKAEELNLKPIAVLKDNVEYRYPVETFFNGKQNRVIQLNSNSSHVAEFLDKTGVTINHNRDCWEIVPLDGQSFDGIKFVNNYNINVIDNVLEAKYIPLNNIKIMFKEKGKYLFRLQVSDSNGNVSEWLEQIITIHEDLSPTINATLNSKYYRNSNKVATITFNALPKSNDYDIPEIVNIGYKFDSNNNGSFEDEILQTTNMISKDINIDGVIYKQITLTTSNVGKYQFIINVKEIFGQETIDKYITEQEYKTVNIKLNTEIDNIAPIGTLGLQKENNIDIKILTSGLTGTRLTDLQTNISNLKTWVESENNIKVSNIEVVDMANRVNGLVSPNTLTWRKVQLKGSLIDNGYKFRYIDIPVAKHAESHEPFLGCCVEMLPDGIYANGWNGLEIPSMFFYGYDYDTTLRQALKPHSKDGDGNPGTGHVAIRSNFYDYRYGPNYAMMGFINGSVWQFVMGDVDVFTLMSEQKMKDFDLQFELTSSKRRWTDDRGRYCLTKLFAFNIKDKNNYYMYYEKECNNYNSDHGHNSGFEQHNIDTEIYPSGIIQVKDGIEYVIDTFHYRNDLGRYDKEDKRWINNYYKVNRFVQNGNNLDVYAISIYGSRYKKVRSLTLEDKSLGGYIGISASSSLTTHTVALNMNSLDYITNSGIKNTLEDLNWNKDTDKYVINLIEDNKIDELVNNYIFNQNVFTLQEKDISVINIGVNSVNGTKLKDMITKNNNNGKYVELSNIYSNLNSAATYIKNNYNTSPTEKIYLLLGEGIKYSENYTDTENDMIFSNEYRFNHTSTFFDNNLGTINNNNTWLNKPITTAFNKTGRYILDYRVKDNPFFPDMSITNNFNSYRKYSNTHTKEIYVHRKPIASFKIDKSFADNMLTYNKINSDDLDLYIRNVSSADETGQLIFKSKTININMPDDAINPKLTYKINDYDDKYANNYLYINGNRENSFVNKITTIDLPIGEVDIMFTLYGRDYNAPFSMKVSDLSIEYYTPNLDSTVPVIENSYDLDNTSKTNKGIVEWEWKVIDKNDIASIHKATSRTASTNLIKNVLSTNRKWENATVLLRVKDLENTWSDWTKLYISKDVLITPDRPDDEIVVYKPTADFTIDKNPLKFNTETQIITDRSSDPENLVLTNIWTVKKDDTTLFTSTQKDINTKLNQEINKNGLGNYEVSLIVTNSKGIESDEVIKDFTVVIFNDAPTVNFNLVSNQNPVWTFPKTLGLYTLRYRPSNTLFFEEYTRFDTNVNDPNVDNTGFIYNWKLERFAVKDIGNISGASTNTYNYTTQFPFVNSFKNQGLGWGAYKITLKVTDKPPIPPYTSADSKSMEVTKYYYIVPEISLVGSFESSKTEIMVGDTVTLKAKTNKLVNNVDCIFNGVTYNLGKKSEDSSFIYWEKDIVIPESITESGTYNLQFIGKTIYGGNGNFTREVRDNTPIDIISLKLINFRISNMVNHPYITFPYTKDMLISNLIHYKTGYYVTFQIDSKGKPDNVHGRIDVGNNGTIEQNISMTKIVTGDTETWQGRFYTQALLPSNTVISIKLDCKKGTTTYNYNEKENWNGRSLIINGSALQDGRINLTN